MKVSKKLVLFLTITTILLLSACGTAALKISTSLAIVGAIVGEFVGANEGLGYVVLLSSYHMDTPVMFSAIIASAACGLLLFWFISWLEKKLIFWQRVDEI